MHNFLDNLGFELNIKAVAQAGEISIQSQSKGKPASNQEFISTVVSTAAAVLMMIYSNAVQSGQIKDTEKERANFIAQMVAPLMESCLESQSLVVPPQTGTPVQPTNAGNPPKAG